MYTKEQLNGVYRRIADAVDISDAMFDKAEREYTALGKWIDTQTPEYGVELYPQGSLELGTVVRPISDEEDYDLDIVCQFDSGFNGSARQLKMNIIYPLLDSYRKTSTLRNKRRCLQVVYEDARHFHMDVIPARGMNNQENIQITEHDEETDGYSYIESNPKGYTKWFLSRCENQRRTLRENYLKTHNMRLDEANLEKVPRREVKTPLQQAVQLLKRHRDIMFKDVDTNKPISIIITTMAASLYNDEGNIVDTLHGILTAADAWLNNSVNDKGYFIDNPSCHGENFADKWNAHPERATAFRRWLRKAQEDLASDETYKMSRVELGEFVKRVFGEKTGQTVFSEMAEEDRASTVSGEMKVDTSTGNLTKSGTVNVPGNHHYGT